MRTPTQVLPGLILERSRADTQSWWYTFRHEASGEPLTHPALSRLPTYKVAAWAQEHLASVNWSRPKEQLLADPAARQAVGLISHRFPYDRR